MKSAVILAILIALVGSGVWCGVMKKSMADEGIWLLTAMGNAHEKKVQVVVAAETGAVFRNPPREDKDGNTLWEEWLTEHYEMRDDSGNLIPGSRIAHTSLVDEQKVKGLPEFFVLFTVEQGKAHTLDYLLTSKKGNKIRYRHSFIAPDSTLPPERVTFKPVAN